MRCAADRKALRMGRVALRLGTLALAVIASLADGTAAMVLTALAAVPLLAAASSRLACRFGRFLKPAADASADEASRR
jgi:hypothetical protein